MSRILMVTLTFGGLVEPRKRGRFGDRAWMDYRPGWGPRPVMIENAKMIELTKDRLEAARFFLRRMQEERVKQARPNKPDPAHFRHYLTAFVHLARSVTWVLKSE